MLRMKLKELIENEIGNAHDNPNIDNDVVADLMKEYAKLKCREQKILYRANCMNLTYLMKEVL